MTTVRSHHSELRFGLSHLTHYYRLVRRLHCNAEYSQSRNPATCQQTAVRTVRYRYFQ